MTNTDLLHRFVGEWTTEATHPMFPGTIVRGTATLAWLEGEKFLIWRARTDHPKFPHSISILGDTERDREEGAASSELTMSYFDSRGVYRSFRASIDGETLELVREAPGFSQRMLYTLSSDGRTIDGKTQLRREAAWEDDLMITFRRSEQ